MLWENFKRSLIEDFIRRGLPEDEAVEIALIKIQAILVVNGRRLSEFDIQEPVTRNLSNDDDDEDDDINNLQMDVDQPLNPQLNDDQQIVFDAIMNAVNNENEQRRLFYLCGAGGIG